MFQANNPYIESDFEGHYAKVYTVVVEPGDYDIWIMVMNAYYTYPDPTVTQPIRVKPGEVKYIGEFFVEGCGKVQIYPRDRKERDLAFVQGIDPAFDPDKVTVEIFKTIEREPEDQS